jgi:nicotinamidase-related amidase
LVITGSETDVCVPGTVLGAVDVGYRVIIVRDAICSSSDEGHDPLMEVYHSRFSEQIETANADEILDRDYLLDRQPSTASGWKITLLGRNVA